MTLDPREQAAWEDFARRGRFHVPSVVDVPEVSTEKAVFESLAVLLRQIGGRVEHVDDPSQADAKAFVRVLVDVPTADDGAQYPAALIDAVSSSDLDSLVDQPVRDGDEDVVTDTHALWCRGEDVGDATVKIFATSEPEAVALATAVREAIGGNLDTWSGAGLPMPLRSIPPPFRDHEHWTACRWPTAALTPDDSRSPPVVDPESGVWVVDVDFTWRATRYVARPRIADFRPFVTVTTEP